jgi:hypothetical protein
MVLIARRLFFILLISLPSFVLPTYGQQQRVLDLTRAPKVPLAPGTSATGSATGIGPSMEGQPSVRHVPFDLQVTVKSLVKDGEKATLSILLRNAGSDPVVLALLPDSTAVRTTGEDIRHTFFFRAELSSDDGRSVSHQRGTVSVSRILAETYGSPHIKGSTLDLAPQEAILVQLPFDTGIFSRRVLASASLVKVAVTVSDMTTVGERESVRSVEAVTSQAPLLLSAKELAVLRTTNK